VDDGTGRRATAAPTCQLSPTGTRAVTTIRQRDERCRASLRHDAGVPNGVVRRGHQLQRCVSLVDPVVVECRRTSWRARVHGRRVPPAGTGLDHNGIEEHLGDDVATRRVCERSD
jgi:hypothetical protein